MTHTHTHTHTLFSTPHLTIMITIPIVYPRSFQFDWRLSLSRREEELYSSVGHTVSVFVHAEDNKEQY